MNNKSELKIYRSKTGEINIEARIQDDTIWLTLNQIAELFDTDKSGISRHIKNIFATGELDPIATVAKNATVQREGSRIIKRNLEYYNLDAIISVCYRVNSQKATDFRIWAGKVLKEYLVTGIVCDQKRLQENQQKFLEVQQLLLMIGKKAKYELLKGREKDLLDLITEYAKSWRVLEDFDKKELIVKKMNKQVKFSVSYDGFLELIGEMKNELAKLKINIYLFGQEVGPKLKSIVGAVNQTFDGKDLYPSVEEKAANLLYLIIKDRLIINLIQE